MAVFQVRIHGSRLSQNHGFPTGQKSWLSSVENGSMDENHGYPPGENSWLSSE